MVNTAPTAFGQVILFLDGLGFFNVVLPFLLVFALTYAILEKTAILGGDANNPKSNLNAIVAFAVGFFVIASAPLVWIIEDVLSKTIILVLAGIAIMITIGIFNKGDTVISFAMKDGKWEDPRAKWFMIAVILIVVMIFLGSIHITPEFTVLEWLYFTLITKYQSGLISTILLFVLLIWGVGWMSGDSK